MEHLDEIFWTALLWLMNEAPGIKIRQADLARRTGLSTSYINDIIKKRNPGSDAAHRKIAGALGFPGRQYEQFLDIGRAILAGRRPETALRQSGWTGPGVSPSAVPADNSPPPPRPYEPVVFENSYEAFIRAVSPGNTREEVESAIRAADRVSEPLKLVPPMEPQSPMPMIGLVECNKLGWEQAMPISVSAAPLSIGPNAFAVITEGDSMKPEGITRGMFCYCDPDQKPIRGDAVYISTKGKKGNLGTIKVFWGEGPAVSLPEGWLKVKGFGPVEEKTERQRAYFLNIPPEDILLVATVIYVRRRL